jgi:hypothetical protein
VKKYILIRAAGGEHHHGVNKPPQYIKAISCEKRPDGAFEFEMPDGRTIIEPALGPDDSLEEQDGELFKRIL